MAESLARANAVARAYTVLHAQLARPADAAPANDNHSQSPPAYPSPYPPPLPAHRAAGGQKNFPRKRVKSSFWKFSYF